MKSWRHEEDSWFPRVKKKQIGEPLRIFKEGIIVIIVDTSNYKLVQTRTASSVDLSTSGTLGLRHQADSSVTVRVGRTLMWNGTATCDLGSHSSSLEVLLNFPVNQKLL